MITKEQIKECIAFCSEQGYFIDESDIAFLLVNREFRDVYMSYELTKSKGMPSGKKQLLAKKEMNAMLGKGRSMDLLDPVAMRMLPVLDLPYGDELSGTVRDDDEDDGNEDENIYNDSFWA